MPAKKRPPIPKARVSQPAWQVILEGIHSDNRATIEAVHATRKALEERIDRSDRESRDRDAVLEAAIRGNSSDIRGLRNDVDGLKTTVGALDGRLARVENKVDTLITFEERLAALERRRA